MCVGNADDCVRHDVIVPKDPQSGFRKVPLANAQISDHESLSIVDHLSSRRAVQARSMLWVTTHCLVTIILMWYKVIKYFTALPTQ